MKRRYVKDYKREADTEHFYYTGTYYTHSLDKEICKQNGRRQLFGAAAEMLLLVGAGFLNSPGTYTWYVILPMVGMFFPITYYMMGTWAFMHGGNRMEEYQYEESFVRMMKCTAIGLFLNLFALCGDVFLIVRSVGIWKGYSEYLLLTSLVILAVLNGTAFVSHSRLMKQIEQEKPSTKKV